MKLEGDCASADLLWLRCAKGQIAAWFCRFTGSFWTYYSTVGSFLNVYAFIVHKNHRNACMLCFYLCVIFGLVLVMFVVS